MKTLSRTYNRVRAELHDVGLLRQGEYLDEIECVRAAWPSFGEAGYVYDNGVSWIARLAGFEPGTIYIPFDAPVEAYVPGGTLVDTIRHEFAHSWAWLDRELVDGPWFRRTFSGRYCDDNEEGERLYGRFRHNEAAFRRSASFASHVSPYALVRPAEDFAETFMTYLRCRKSLGRFEKRPELMTKLRAVETTVQRAARQVSGRVRAKARSTPKPPKAKQKPAPTKRSVAKAT